MAIPISPSMYSGGAVELDGTPVVNMYARLMAKKQAKEEAIDEYYKKLPSTLNSAGMRGQSIPGFNKGLEAIEKNFAENKDRIREGTTPEAFNYEKMIRELGQKVNEDKNAAKTDLELGKMRFNKENSYIFKDKKFIDNLTQHGLSVFDQNHKAIDLGTVTIPPKPFDVKDQDEYYKSITTGIEAGKQYDYSKSYTNPQTGQVIVPTIDVFNDDQIGKAAKRAMELVGIDESKQAYFEELLHSPDKKEWQVLQDAYSKYFKGDVVDTPEKAAAADAIIKLSIPKKYAKEQESNYGQKQADKITIMNINDGLIRGRKTGGIDGDGDFDIVGNYNKDAEKVVVREKVGGGMFPKYEEKTEYRVFASNIPDYHQKYLGDIAPKTDPTTGKKYYKVLPNNDWEGQKGTIKRATVEQAYRDANTSLSKRTGLRGDGSTGNTPPKPANPKPTRDKSKTTPIPQGAVIGKQN